MKSRASGFRCVNLSLLFQVVKGRNHKAGPNVQTQSQELHLLPMSLQSKYAIKDTGSREMHLCHVRTVVTASS